MARFARGSGAVAVALILVGCSRGSSMIFKHEDVGTTSDAASVAAPKTPIARNGPPVSALAAGRGTTCAVREGEVWCWGQALGITDLDRVMVVPTRVENLKAVTSVSVSSAHACAVLAGGSVRCWGDNRWGQLGDGTTTERKAPVAVRGISGATQVAAAQHHTCAIVGGAAQC